MTRPLQKRIAAFAVAALLLVVGSHFMVEALSLRFAQPEADDSLRALEVFRSRTSAAEVVLLGSSQVRRDLLAPQLASELSAAAGRPVSVFNLGLQGGTMAAYYLVARDLLVGEQTPRLVVLGLGPRDLNSNSPRGARVMRHLYALGDVVGPLHPHLAAPAEWGALPLLLFRAPATLLQSWRRWSSAEQDFAAAVLERGGSEYESASAGTEADQATVDADTRQKRTERRAREARESLLVDFTTTGRAEWALGAFFTLAEQRHLKIVVVDLPVASDFATLAYTHDEYATYRGMLERLCAAAHVMLVDATDAPYRPEDSDFLDGDHMSAPAAERFTHRMAPLVAAALP